jgi:predicted Zn-dependent protease
LDEIREVPDQAGGDQLVLKRTGDTVQRLILPGRALLSLLPQPHKRQPVPNRGRIFGWALGAVASVALIIFVLVPTMANQLAGFIPPEGERALGEVTLDQIRAALGENQNGTLEFCEDSKGLAALQKMEQRLSASLDLEVPLSVHVLNHDMVNAFALPGGYIVFFKGLLDAADTPEEIAAVFAHEIGHVVSRDPTRNALRSAGSIGVLGLVFGDFAGGALVLFLTERLIEAQYSRTAEAQADVFAHSLLLEAEVAPSALADMFERFRELGGEPEGIVAHFLSHPQLGDRIAAAVDATPEGFTGTPLLSDTEWDALKGICR